jgi:hypothetical protein
LIAPIVASMSAKPVRIMRTVFGCRSYTLARNSTPVISGMRWSEITTAIGEYCSSFASPSTGEDEVTTS